MMASWASVEAALAGVVVMGAWVIPAALTGLMALFSWLGGRGSGSETDATGGAMDPELQALMRKLLNLQVGQTEQNEPLRQAVSQLAFRRLPIHARTGFSMPGATSRTGLYTGKPGDQGGGAGGGAGWTDEEDRQRRNADRYSGKF